MIPKCSSFACIVESCVVRRCYSNHCVPFSCKPNTLKQETELAHGRRFAGSEETTAMVLKAAAQFRVLATEAKQRRYVTYGFLLNLFYFILPDKQMLCYLINCLLKWVKDMSK